MAGLDIGILFVFGVSVFGGMLGAWFFQKIRIPQVVGYIIIGLIIGQSGFNLVGADDIATLRPFNLFALGVIGFLVGGELRVEEFRAYFKQFAAILLGEGLLAFFLVGCGTAVLVYLAVHNVAMAVAAGIVFGAIASATDPASTIDVLWEYRCAGILTTGITAIVALDDALAMTLYGLGVSAATLLTGGQSSFSHEFQRIVMELGGALFAGAAFAGLLVFILRRVSSVERNAATALGLILTLIYLAVWWDMDVILATMAFGFTLTNAEPRRSRDLFKTLRSFSVPIYVLFFVLVGATLGLAKMPGWLWLVVLTYSLGRSIGKIGGTWFGAKVSGAPPVTRRYLGLGLMAQGGVAVGLSLMASQRLGNIAIAPDLTLGEAIVFAITATTLIAQLMGPPLVKLAVALGGETGRNITEDDVIATLRVKDVMDADVKPVSEDLPVLGLVELFGSGENLVYPVVDSEGNIVGVVMMENLKHILNERDAWRWMLASDIMGTVCAKANPSSPLREALDLAHELKIEQIPVVDENDPRKPVGILDLAQTRRRVGKETLRRQKAVASA